MVLSAIGEIASVLWNEIRNHVHNIQLREFVIMPNHVHGIIEITNSVANVRVGATHASPLQCDLGNRRGGACPAPTLATIVGSYKSAVSKHVRRSGFTEFAWQRNYFEHIIRNEHSYENIAHYIINNPTTWEKDRFNIVSQQWKKRLNYSTIKIEKYPFVQTVL
jgi:REP element-mobilizing transposase RayT